jgi:hypothetical protein
MNQRSGTSKGDGSAGTIDRYRYNRPSARERMEVMSFFGIRVCWHGLYRRYVPIPVISPCLRTVPRQDLGAAVGMNEGIHGSGSGITGLGRTGGWFHKSRHFPDHAPHPPRGCCPFSTAASAGLPVPLRVIPGRYPSGVAGFPCRHFSCGMQAGWHSPGPVDPGAGRRVGLQRAIIRAVGSPEMLCQPQLLSVVLMQCRSPARRPGAVCRKRAELRPGCAPACGRFVSGQS